jgi:diguanylate cyclase (GGDEF)-like protein
MDLDIRTLLIANAMSIFIISIAFSFISRSQKLSSCLQYISTAFLALASGITLVALRNIIPDFFSVVISNTLIVTWIFLIWRAMNYFQGTTYPLKSALISFFLFIALFLFYTYITPNFIFRIIIVSLMIAIVSLFIARDIYKNTQHKFSTVVQRYMLISFVALSIIMLVRIGGIFLEKINHDLMSGDAIYQITLILTIALSIAFALGILWVLLKDLEAKLLERAKDLEEAALHDHLTHAGNRRKFNIVANEERSRHIRHQRHLSLALLDIDHFKKVNDTFGHDVGDEVLTTLVKKISEVTRDIDAIYRWGGEEFTVLMPETNIDMAIKACERIRQHVEKNILTDHGPLTISIGVTELRNEESINSLVKRADILMYQAKTKGRNRVVSDS